MVIYEIVTNYGTKFISQETLEIIIKNDLAHNHRRIIEIMRIWIY